MGVGAPKAPYQVTLTFSAVDADTPYVLVDLSDTTNFPHANTNHIVLRGLNVVTGNANFDVYIGVVVENDATDGTAHWLYYSRGVTSESYRVPEHGIDLTVDATNKRLRFVRTNSTQADSVNWQNDTNRVSPVGSATKPGVGDLVLWLDETAGTETVTGRVDVYYDTE